MNIEPNCNVRQLRRPASISEGRRKRANMPARIKVGPNRATVTVTDVSASGACLAFDGPLSADVEIWLVIDRFPPISATTAWRRSNRVGLRFHQDQDWVGQVHKDRFDASAWLQDTNIN
jgi:PilZ domain-containing protein